MDTIKKYSWEQKIQESLKDQNALKYIKRALLKGYQNLNIKQSELLIDKIFYYLSENSKLSIEQELEYIRKNISSNWHGKSIKEIWSDYYREVEAPFISSLIGEHIQGNRVLEVGVGRGWISHNLFKKFVL